MRRANRFLLYLLPLCLLSLAGARAGQQTPTQPSQYRPEPAALTLNQVRDNIYEVRGGSGANGGVVIGEKEVLVIDAKMTEDSARALLSEIAKITPLPLGWILLTHSDGDHVNGLTGFPAGLRIISQENTRKHMEAAFQEQRQRDFLPDILFSEKMSLHLDGRRVDGLHFGPAHTDGDAVFVLPEEKVAFVGDLLFIGRDPLIHRSKNGSSFGLAKTLRALLALDVDTYLSGHAAPAGKADVKKLLKDIEEKQARVQALLGEKKSLEEIKRIMNVPEAQPLAGRPRWPSLVEVIYLELTEKKS